MLGKVEIGSILDAQHPVRPLRPFPRARPMRRQDVLRRHGGGRQLVDHPVVSRHGCLLPLRRGRKGRHRAGSLNGRALRQPPAQPHIAQRRAAELGLRPVLPVEPVSGTPRRNRYRRRKPQLLPPVPGQRTQPDRFHRHLGSGRGKAAAALGLANPDPGRRRQAGPGVL